GRSVGFDLLDISGAGDDAGDLGLGPQPGEGEAEPCPPARLRVGADTFDEVQVLLSEMSLPAGVAGDAGAPRLRTPTTVLSRQETAEQREVRQERDAEAGAGRQDLQLGFAPQQAVLVLDADEASAAGGRDAFGLLQLGSVEVRAAGLADRPLLDKL